MSSETKLLPYWMEIFVFLRAFFCYSSILRFFPRRYCYTSKTHAASWYFMILWSDKLNLATVSGVNSQTAFIVNKRMWISTNFILELLPRFVQKSLWKLITKFNKFLNVWAHVRSSQVWAKRSHSWHKEQHFISRRRRVLVVIQPQTKIRHVYSYDS